MQEMQRLLSIMAKLRDPNGGCPWDVEQDFASIAPYTLEEAYEVADAIERKDMAALKEELGDLLLQVVFHSQMAKERGLFSFEEVAAAINEKMISRHPHVSFERPAIAPTGAHMGGSSDDSRSGLARSPDHATPEIKTANDQLANWDRLKAEEKKAKGHASILDDIPMAFPALLRAQKLTKKAAKVGFDWPSIEPVFDKLEEEIAELKEAITAGDMKHAEEELGDVLFVCVNLARHIKADAENALRLTNRKFEQRFRYVEKHMREGATLEEMDALWDEAKIVLKM